MTRLLTTGAEETSPNEIWTDIDDSSTALGNTLVQYGYAKSNSIAPRTGRGMYTLDANTSLGLDFGTNTSHIEIYMGFAVNIPTFSSATLVNFITDSPGATGNYLGFRLNTDGSVSFMRTSTVLATSAPVFSIDTWHYVEVWVKPLNTNGSMVAKVDETTILEFSGDTTNDLELVNMVKIYGQNVAGNYHTTYYDDIVINDSNGSDNNTWTGQVHLLPIFPQTDGTYGEWSRAGVDFGENSINSRNGVFEYTMLQTDSEDKKVTFIPEIPVLGANATITNIIVSSRDRVESGSGVIRPILISGSTVSVSGSQALNSIWRVHQQVWSTNPDTSGSWVEANLANLEIGVSS